MTEANVRLMMGMVRDKRYAYEKEVRDKLAAFRREEEGIQAQCPHPSISPDYRWQAGGVQHYRQCRVCGKEFR